MPGLLASAATGAVAVFGLLHLLLHWIHDAREPPVAPTSIPFFGHMIGMARKKNRYYVELRFVNEFHHFSSHYTYCLTSNKYQLPIYTLHLPGSRLYILNSVSLIPAVQKQVKALAFPPIEALAAKNVCGTSKVANDILDTNVNGEDGAWGYSMTHYPAIRLPLYPGAGLDAMNRVMAQKVAASIDGMTRKQDVKLFAFIKHEVTFATTESVYGPQNPFRDRELEESFWYVLKHLQLTGRRADKSA